MIPSRSARWPVGLIALLLALPGCSPKTVTNPHENQRPIVQFTRAPSRSGDLYSYSYEMFWAGFDPDGELREYQYAIDPPSPTPTNPEPDSAWVSTTRTRATLHFQATTRQPSPPGTPLLATDYHVVVLRALDDRGLVSEPQMVAFNAFTVAPSVRIVSPRPSSRGRPLLPPSLTVEWEGDDVDGITTQLPTHYRVKLFTASTPITPATINAFADTVIRYYLPLGWATWDSLGPSETRYSLSLLSPDQEYALVVIGFDEAGAFTPYTSRDANVLYFRASYAAAAGPVLTLSNEFFSYTYAIGTYAPNDPRSEISLEVPANLPLHFEWSADPVEGTDVRWFRWVLDPVDFDDNTPRSNERTDLRHWSQASLFVTSCDLPGFTEPGVHRLYVEVGDGNGLKSLGVIRMQSVVPDFSRPLGIVDDTRLALDRRSTGSTTCIDRPLGPYPTAAELDTFLYARGGYPIRCYPAGYYSRPGLFRGYDFDTLNTRVGRANPSPTLSVLGRYQRLIWLVDPDGSESTTSGTSLTEGITALRYMNTPGNFNVLAAYVRAGGEVWLAGGGSLSASCMPYNIGANDRPTRTFSTTTGELRRGTFTYDMIHWRSEIKPTTGQFAIQRQFGRNSSSPGPYALFPPSLDPRNIAAGDSMPPWRTNPGDFNRTTAKVEALVTRNSIVEDADPSDDVFLVSAMDTIYAISGGILPIGSVGMTAYVGQDNPRIIVSGFDIWSFRRAQLVVLVDAVLQGLWGLSRQP